MRANRHCFTIQLVTSCDSARLLQSLCIVPFSLRSLTSTPGLFLLVCHNRCTVATSYNLYHFVLLCTTLYYFVLLCTTLYYFLLLCTTLYYFVLLCTTLYNFIPLHTTSYYFIPLPGQGAGQESPQNRQRFGHHLQTSTALPLLQPLSHHHPFLRSHHLPTHNSPLRAGICILMCPRSNLLIRNVIEIFKFHKLH